ncbi:MAG: recombinase family protein [Frisingicoccus sp.]
MDYKYILGYVRLSRDDVDRSDESNSIKNQKLLIQYFIEQNEELKDCRVVFFVDDGVSGTSFDRPGFKKMMEFVQKEKFCCIIVKDLSRFGRDTIDSQNYLEKVFPFLHVRFIAINDFFDSDAALISNKDTEIKFKNLINGIYPQICSRNIKQVMKKQAELGMYHGAVPPFGYKFPEERRTALLVDREAAEIVKYIFEQGMAEKTDTDIARLLNEQRILTPAQYLQAKGYYRNLQVAPIWTRYMVAKILMNPVYTGMMVNHKTENRFVSVKSAVAIPREEWICVPNTHEAIIAQNNFELVKEIRDRRSNKRKHLREGAKNSNGNNKKPVLSGKIKCGHCKRTVRIRAEACNKTIKFYCTSVRVTNSLGCYEKGYIMSAIEELVLILIRKQAALANDSIKAAKLMNQTLDSSRLRHKKKTLEDKTKSCKKEKMELYEKYIAGDLERNEYLLQKNVLSEKENTYKGELDEIDRIFEETSQKEVQSLKLKNIAQYMNLEELSIPIVEELIEVIYFYDPEHIEVVWNFKDDLLECAK